jgi:hypothetical protein
MIRYEILESLELLMSVKVALLFLWQCLTYRVSDKSGRLANEPIPCSTEREIFEKLGLRYQEPWERNVFDEKTAVLESAR